MFLENLEQIRAVEWAKDHQWDVRFPDAPAPFSSWFPATDIQEDLAIINTETIPGPLTSYKVPLNSSPFSIRMSFYDDSTRSLTNWLTNWINTIVNPTQGYVKTLSESCKIVQIEWLDSMRNTIRTATYLVFPDGGNLTKIGGSHGQPEIISYSFTVAKVIESSSSIGIANGSIISTTFGNELSNSLGLKDIGNRIGGTVGGLVGGVVGNTAGNVIGNVVRNTVNNIHNNAINRANQAVNKQIGKIENKINQNIRRVNNQVNSQITKALKFK